MITIIEDESMIEWLRVRKWKKLKQQVGPVSWYTWAIGDSIHAVWHGQVGMNDSVSELREEKVSS